MSDDRRDHDSEDMLIAGNVLRVQDLWDEIAHCAEEVPLTEAQRSEAERRLLEHERNPKTCLLWQEVKRRLESPRRRATAPEQQDSLLATPSYYQQRLSKEQRNARRLLNIVRTIENRAVEKE